MLYRLSRFSKLHQTLRKALYFALYRIPYPIKYGAGRWLRRWRMPYRLIKPGATVVQVGAPWDLLRAGRSRAAYFALFVGPHGRVFVLEPDADSAFRLRNFADRMGLSNLMVVEKGVWDKRTRLRFLVNPDHPASNIVEEVCKRDAWRNRSGYTMTEIEVDTLENILDEAGLPQVDLLSVTTNGSEHQALAGLGGAVDRIRHLSVILGAERDPLLGEMNFAIIGGDDRGFSFARVGVQGSQGKIKPN